MSKQISAGDAMEFYSLLEGFRMKTEDQYYWRLKNYEAGDNRFASQVAETEANFKEIEKEMFLFVRRLAGEEV